MPNTAAHFVDLRRRYRETDWVSEYQRLWAMFNHWLFTHSGRKKTDREAIEVLKVDVNLAAWVGNLVQSSAIPRPHNVNDGYSDSYPRFAADNEISLFFRAAQRSPVLEPRLNWPWRVGAEGRVKQTNAIALDVSLFRKAYEVHAVVLTDGIDLIDKTLHKTLELLGVSSTGCCFYRRAPANPASALEERTARAIRAEPTLAPLTSLLDSQVPTELAPDVVETLYNLRNVAMHGSLDFLVPADNAVARAGCDLLDALIKDIADRW